MHAQGLPTTEIAIALNGRKTVSELKKIIEVLQSEHTDHLGRISDAHVNKAPPAKRGSSAEKDGLQKSRPSSSKKPKPKSSHAKNVKLSNANRNKYKKNRTDTKSVHSHKHERVEKENQRKKKMKKERPRANKVGTGIAI